MVAFERIYIIASMLSALSRLHFVTGQRTSGCSRNLKKYADEFGKDIKSIEPDVLQRLHRHPFNGNVRELENLIERATALAEGNSIAIEHLPPGFGQQPLGTGTVDSKIELPIEGLNLDALINEIEGHLIEQALQKTGGRKKDAASLLGITFRSLRYRLDKLDITYTIVEHPLREMLVWNLSMPDTKLSVRDYGGRTRYSDCFHGRPRVAVHELHR